jgi:hypothetical protein
MYIIHFADFCPKFDYFLASKVYVGRFGQFKAHYYDAQAISKHIVKILKKI